MATATVRSGTDTTVTAARPNRADSGASRLTLLDGARESFIFFPSPVPAGATVVSAQLRLYVAGGDATTPTVVVHKVTERASLTRLTWDTRPTVGTILDAVGLIDPADGDEVLLNVTSAVQSDANGGSNFGFRLTAVDDTEVLRLYSLEAGELQPQLIVEWSEAPQAPTGLQPDGVVSITHPDLGFDFRDFLGNTDLDAVQVQVDPAMDGDAPFYDSGAFVTSSAEFYLYDSGYTGVPLDGTPHYWRVRLRDGLGLWSPWSEWAELTYIAKPTLTLHFPAPEPDNYASVEEAFIDWSLAGGSQKAYRVIVRDANTNEELYDSGRVKSTLTYHVIPSGVLTEFPGAYDVFVRVWDTVAGRVASPGDPTYTQVSRYFTLRDEPSVDPVTDLEADSSGLPPGVTLTWSRTDVPEGFTIRRGSKIVATVDAADVSTGPTTYSYTDDSAPLGSAQTYSVHAVNYGVTSEGVTVTAPRITFPGVILMEDRARWLPIAGEDAVSITSTDDAELFNPLGAAAPVRIISGTRGVEGTVTGLLLGGFGGLTMQQQLDRVNRWKRHPATKFRLLLGDDSYRVIVGDLTVAPSTRSRPGAKEKLVSFSFWQVEARPYD